MLTECRETLAGPARARREAPPAGIPAGDLFACQPIAAAIQDAASNCILTCKPSSHQTIAGYLYGARPEERRTTTVTPGKGRSTTIYRWHSGVPLRATDDAIMVNWFSLKS